MNYNEIPHPNYSRPERLDKKNNRKDSLVNQIYALTLMKNTLQSHDLFQLENTITKLEEKENDNMNEENKSMKTLEACDYLLYHKDEYLVSKKNESFELHFGDDGFYTKDLNIQPVFIKELVMDNHRLHTEWVKPQKPHVYQFLVLGYFQDKLVYHNTHTAKSKRDLCLCVLDFLKYKISDDIRKQIPEHRNNSFLFSDIKLEIISMFDYEGKQLITE